MGRALRHFAGVWCVLGAGFFASAEDLVDIHRVASFGSSPTDPKWPGTQQALAEGPDHVLYTTTPAGGEHGMGAIVRIDQAGRVETLYSFDGVHGSSPRGGLVRARDGSFYGTANQGGEFKAGTVFRYRLGARQPEVLYSFRNGVMPPVEPGETLTEAEKLDAAGAYPASAPVQGADGAWYGVTTYAYHNRYGVLYRIAGGVFHALYFFDGKQGKRPLQLVAGDDGLLYGIAMEGGDAHNRYGTVFSATTSGAVHTLHAFDGSDGVWPASLTYGRDGVLYGTTALGGLKHNRGFGTVFKVTREGDFKVLHQFNPRAGADPTSGVIDGPGGYLYGAARHGGLKSGVLYRLRQDDGGDWTIVHSFQRALTGHGPLGQLLLTSTGEFYGTTSEGGEHNRGTVYRFSAPDCPLPARPGQPDVAAGNPAYEDTLLEIRINVVATQGGIPNDATDHAITLRIKSANRPHVVQFIYRERIAKDGKRYPGRVPLGHMHLERGKTVSDYPLTGDPTHPIWVTDSNMFPDPRYDSGKASRRDCTSLTIIDQPDFPTPVYHPGNGETSCATVRSFILVGGEVACSVTWTREIQDNSPPVFSVQPPVTVTKADYLRFLQISREQGFQTWP